MKNSKRTFNRAGLKVRYLGPTNTRGSRVKFTQTNSGKSCIVSYDYRFDTLGMIDNFINHIPAITDYHIVIDNTQNDYYLISFDTDANFPIIDVISAIRKLSEARV